MKLRPMLLASFPFLIMGLSWAMSEEWARHPARAGVDATRARKTLVVRAIDRVKGAVVNIHSERPGQSSRPIQGMGTGIVIDPRGYIVTNQHVVDEVTSLRCRLSDGNTHVAVIVARNAELDLALIKIDADSRLPIMPLGTASDLMVGETVIAIGNAFGYEHTASMGIVSAVKRDVNLNQDMYYKSLIQTDASINPGNSGGPLINVHGELVGVNVAIRDKAQGIGFAIPVDNMIRSVADMLHSRRRTYDGLVVRRPPGRYGANGPVRTRGGQARGRQQPGQRRRPAGGRRRSSRWATCRCCAATTWSGPCWIASSMRQAGHRDSPRRQGSSAGDGAVFAGTHGPAAASPTTWSGPGSASSWCRWPWIK